MGTLFKGGHYLRKYGKSILTYQMTSVEISFLLLQLGRKGSRPWPVQERATLCNEWQNEIAAK